MSTFLDYTGQLESARPRFSLGQCIAQAGGPQGVAVVVVDLIRGFCDSGPLASPRVNALVGPTADFLTRAHEAGIRKLYFPCDSHPPDSPEFRSFPPHCLEGSAETDLPDALRALPAAADFRVFPKKSLDALLDTGLEEVLCSDPQLRTLLFLGDCTDLCVYHSAMHARLLANVRHLPWTVAVLSDLTQTFDLPLPVAQQIGAMAHDGDFLHRVFLYQMQLNGIEIHR